MILAIAITAGLIVLSGLALKFVIPRFWPDAEWHISWREFIVGALVACVVVLPSVFAVGKLLTNQDALRYEEFYNGVETDATFSSEDCYPGSSGSSELSGYSNCDHSYMTGETYTYSEAVYYTEQSCNAKGECTTTTKSRQESRTGYIYAPYAQKEYRYVITDSLGGSYGFPGTYVKDGEGYLGQAIPQDVPRGDPEEWVDARAHLDAGNPRPVTRLFDYGNYILASGDELLNAYSDDIDRYLEAELLPDHTANILTDPLYGYSNSSADKVSFVGVEVADPAAWQSSLMYFNAALGSTLQGDMHVVLIDENLVDSRVSYLNALKAYWQSDDFGRRALAKNGVIVVVGVQGDTVAWADATTGMPFGNEVMLQAIETFMPDTPLTPQAVIGEPRTVFSPASSDDEEDIVEVSYGENPGVLEQVVLTEFPFERACMECDEGEGIGYGNLTVDVEPSPLQWFLMILIVMVPTVVWWYVAGKFDFLNFGRRIPRRSFRY